jgi:hypothetical protein
VFAISAMGFFKQNVIKLVLCENSVSLISMRW